jgi:hypothetical protein
MHFRYKDSRGRVVKLDDVTWLAQAVRDGNVGPDTMLAVGNDREFKRAEHLVVYQQVVVGLERSRLGAAPLPDVPERRTPVRARPSRPILAIILGTLAVAVAVFVLRSPSAPPSPVSTVAAPSAETEQALGHLVTEFGDSIAVRQRRLEDWVAAQRFAQRIAGRGLQSAASLRSMREAVTTYLAQVDSLLIGISVLAARLALRADSLEGTDGVRAGLFAAAGDALRGWEGELAAYAAIQRETAAALETMARFALERQRSFVVRDGEPVFLSRDDAGRFRQLRSDIDDLARNERRWAEASLRKHPGWMTGIAPADRPASHGPLPQRSNQ